MILSNCIVIVLLFVYVCVWFVVQMIASMELLIEFEHWIIYLLCEVFVINRM